MIQTAKKLLKGWSALFNQIRSDINQIKMEICIVAIEIYNKDIILSNSQSLQLLYSMLTIL